MADYGPLGGVKIAGFISPGDTTDSYAVIDTTLGIDGLRNYSGDTIEVLSGTTITELRRRAGMIVGIDSGSRYFKLKDKNPWDYDLTDWEEIFFSGGGGAPITGATAFPATQTLTFYNSSGGTFNVVGGEYLFSDISVTGGTYNPDTGCVTFETNSGTTFDVCGFLTISADTFVTGATLNGDILEIGRNQSKPLISVDLSSLVFSGNTSSDCINQLWVSNISGCTGQDLHIGVQPGQDIYFDSTGSTTSPSLYINSKGQIGIGTNTPFSWATNDGTGIEVHNDNTNDQIPLAFTELGTRRFYFETDFATTYNPVHLKGSSGTNLLTFYTSSNNARVGFGTTIPDGTLQVAKSGLIANQSKYPDETNIVINNTSSGYSGDTNPNSAAFRFDHGTGEDPGGLITSKRLPSWDTGEKSTSLEIWNASGETLFKRIEILPDGETTISGELIVDKQGLFFTNLDNSSGPTVNVSGNTAELVEFRVITPTAKAISIGSRGETETTYPGYGKQGDGFLYSSAAQNGLNIISSNGAATEDYIRFFAGTNATSTPSMIILGTGATQGNVGINTNSPTEKLHIEGSIKIVDGTEQNGYVLTSNANGVGSWQPSTGGGGSFTGNTSGDCITDLWVSNIHSCSPLNINPGDEGNVYYGSTSGVTIDVSNSRIGIGTDDPDFPLHVVSTNQVEVKIESSTNNAFLTLSSSNGTNSYIDYEDGSGDRWIVGAHGGDDEKFKWATGTTFGSDTVMTLTREAKLGIGTSDPQANLHIKGITPPIEDNIFLLEDSAGNVVMGANDEGALAIGVDPHDIAMSGESSLFIKGDSSTSSGAFDDTNIALRAVNSLGYNILVVKNGNAGTAGSNKGRVCINGNFGSQLLVNDDAVFSLYGDTASSSAALGQVMSISDGQTNTLHNFYNNGALTLANATLQYSKVGIGTTSAGSINSKLHIKVGDEWKNTLGYDYTLRIDGLTEISPYTASTNDIFRVDNFGNVDIKKRTTTSAFTMTNGAVDGYVLTSDGSGNATWQSSTGGAGAMSFTVDGDNGTPFTITSGDTLTFEGSTGIDVGVAATDRVLIAVDYSGLDSVIMAATNGTGITVDGANDKLLIYDNDAAEVKYINADQLGSSSFTGNTSATCISELWVHTISGCSPVTIGSSIQSGYPNGSTASGINSLAYGKGTIASGDHSQAFGNETIASGYTAHAQGSYTVAGAQGSYAGGLGVNDTIRVLATGSGSFAHFTLGEVASSMGVLGSSSAILGGLDQQIGSDGIYCAIVGGTANNIDSVGDSGIFAGAFNEIEGTAATNYNTIVGGFHNTLTGLTTSTYNSIIGGQYNKMTNSRVLSSVIVGGTSNSIDGNVNGSDNSVIVGGKENTITGAAASDTSDNNIIIGGRQNEIATLNGFNNNTIINGFSNEISGRIQRSAILGGTLHTINESGILNGVIIGGLNSKIAGGVENAVVLGGNGLTASSTNTVYTPLLNINELSDGTPQNNLSVDADGNVVDGFTWSDTQVTNGNTSGDCITELWVTNVESCSPLHINTQNQGNIFFGEQMGGAPLVTVDITTPNEPGMYLGEESFIRYIESQKELIIGEDEAGGKVKIKVEGDDILDVEKVRTVVREGDLETEDGNIVVKSGNSKTVIIEDIPDVSGANLGTDVDGRVIDIPSDSRVKRNITDLHLVVDPLEFLNNVKGYQFQWRPESRIGDPTKFHYGFKVDDFRDNLISAGQTPSLKQQQVNDTAKSMVRRTKRKFMFGTNSQPEHVDKMNYEDLIPFMIEGIKQLNHNILNIDGGGGSGIGKKVITDTFIGNTPKLITHNLNDEDVMVQVKDNGTNELIIPHLVDKYNNNEIYVTVSVSGTYTVIITGGLSNGNSTGSTQSTIVGGGTDGFTGITNNGITINTEVRHNLNLIEGPNISLHIEDNQTNDSVDVTISAEADKYCATTVNAVGVIEWDTSISTQFEVTLDDDAILNLEGLRSGQYGTMIITQDNIGSRTLTLGTVNGNAGSHKVVNGGGGELVLTTNPNAIDIISFTYNGKNLYWTVGNDYT